MDQILKDYLDEKLNEGLDNNFWFMTKQTMTDFYFIFTTAKVVDTFNSKHTASENFGKYYQRFFNEDSYLRDNYPRQGESENTYRNSIISEYLGLVKRDRGQDYGHAESTDAYKTIAKYITTADDLSNYKFIIDRQIEKLCLNINENAQGYEKFKDVKIFPVMLLYKIMFELIKQTGDSKLYFDEFCLFLFRTKKYSEWQNVLNLILAYRKKNIDAEYQNKIEKLLNDDNVSNIRFDALFATLENIELIRENNQSFYQIKNSESSLKYIENEIEIFEASKYCNNESLEELQNFIRSDKYFVGNLDAMFVIQKSKDEEERKMAKTVEEVLDKENRIKAGFNKIYYGAPGCGKSHHVANLMKNPDGTEKNYVRVTFHPEYTNYDFVGQILPMITGPNKVEYQFTPGPFTEALLRAYSSPTQAVYLIIEEINRGNAAAIFGDLFQLLDRDKTQFIDDDRNKPNNNWRASEYSITNPNISAYLKEKLEINDQEEFKISIPSNMIVLATMNSSDQNVFTLDTAFKRRWDFEQIPNDFTSEDVYRNWYVPGTNVKWQNFVLAINDKIVTDKETFQVNEDKRIGKYFVSSDCLTENIEKMSDVKEKAKKFAFKVFEYLWNDVCKIDKTMWFHTENIKTLEKLIDTFVSFSYEPNLEEQFALSILNVDFVRDGND